MQKTCFQLQTKSSINNIEFYIILSNEKVVSFESGEKYAQIKHLFKLNQSEQL